MQYWSDWSFEPLVIVPLLVFAAIYAQGLRSGLRIVGRSRDRQVGRVLAYYVGLFTVFIALESPVDALNETSFAMHMAQHLLLIMVAAPLIILGNPATVLLRGLPLGTRRVVLGGLSRQTWVHRLGSILSWIASPGPVLVIFLVDLYFWHWTVMYNLALQNQVVHDLEHLCFLVTALLFWSQVIDQPALRGSLSYPQRLVYIIIASVFNTMLALYFAFSHQLIYAAYAHVSARPFGLTALSDQSIAGALMWIPTMTLYAVAFSVCLFKALEKDEPDSMPLAQPGMTYDLFSAVTREPDSKPLSLVEIGAQDK